MQSIYAHGGIRGFFVGNGLNVIKIVPESAIKFWAFESAKSVLAKATDAEDKNSISVGARFIAGGMAGLCSQFTIYPYVFYGPKNWQLVPALTFSFSGSKPSKHA
jgi:solute carrier family 25 phosphate transporter 23/24/25/41